MKKIVFIIIILNFVALFSPKLQNSMMAQSNLTLSEAKGIANTYYGAFQQMAKHPVGEIQIQSEFRLLDALGKDDNGNKISSVFRVPNDLIKVVGSSMDNEEPVLITNYIGNFLQIAEEKKTDFSYKVLSSEYQNAPEMVKGEDAPVFVSVMVEKTIKVSNHPELKFEETMSLNTRNKSVALIKNKYRPSVINAENVTTEELLAEAQNMYSNKRYEDAFRLYQKVLEKNPNNDEVWYYVGVMYYKKQGVGNLSKKQRLQKAYECWKKCNLKKAHRAISFITDGRE